jgi:Xaa-Pro aminopeptidase
MKLVLAVLSLGATFFPAGGPSVTPAFFAAHRERLLARLPPGSIAVFHAAPALDLVSSDPYRQDSDFWYLTGLDEPEAVAVLQPGAPKESRYQLFVRPRDFAAEQWAGWRAGVEGAVETFGAGAAFPVESFFERFATLAAPATQLFHDSGGDAEFAEKLLAAWNATNANSAAPRPAADAAPLTSALRLVKDEIEKELLRTASSISAEAHLAAMRAAAPGRHEYELKGAMVGLSLARGAARMAYPPIVGTGRNSVILHYQRDDAELRDGEVLVNDTGCEFQMYAADVTRTLPVSGRFTPDQRKIYELVFAAQEAGLAAIKPGVPFHAVYDATVRVVVDGLLSLGILTGDKGGIIQSRAYQQFYPHGSSHWIGLDVHDAGTYTNPHGVARLERYSLSATPLEPGMALTVEPGIYIPEHSTVDPRWWNIGVRIEDTVLVTAQGYECLSCGAPRSAADVERAME